MKKIFALALAAVMTAGMTTVAFAAGVDINSVEFGGDLTRLFKYDSESNMGVHVDDTTTLSPDSTYYISLEINDVESYMKDAGDLDIDSKDMKKYKVYADWKYGSDSIEVLGVDYKKIELFDTSWGGSDYRYVVVFKTSDDTTNAKDLDVAGTLKVGTSSSKADKVGSYDLDATITKAYINPFDGDFGSYDNGAVVKFEKDLGEIEIDFGELATFEVDVTGQGKLNLKWNTDFNKEFAAMYDYANIDFVTFEGEPSFNKNGTMYIYADEDTFIYEVTADGAKALKAEWNEDYEAWEFKTRKLTSYAISDVELDEQTVTEDKTDDESSKTDDGVKENPDTGR